VIHRGYLIVEIWIKSSFCKNIYLIIFFKEQYLTKAFTTIWIKSSISHIFNFNEMVSQEKGEVRSRTKIFSILVWIKSSI
jgi:hypothetical protein